MEINHLIRLSCFVSAAMQTKAFDEGAGDGEAEKAAGSVAGELRGLLEGSSRINPRKGGAGSPLCVLAVPQVCMSNTTFASLEVRRSHHMMAIFSSSCYAQWAKRPLHC